MMVGTLLICWLLNGVPCSRMSSNVLIIALVGSVFALLNQWSQPSQAGLVWTAGQVTRPRYLLKDCR